MEHSTSSQPLNNAAEVHRLATCNRCGDDKLSWKKSAKTGRWYLCDVQLCVGNRLDGRYFQLARLPHKCPNR